MPCDCDEAVQAMVSGDHATALAKLRVLAGNGDPKAPYILALMYARGQGVVASHREAVNWFRQAAHRGRRTAQIALGFVDSVGRGVPQDYVQAYMRNGIFHFKMTVS